MTLLPPNAEQVAVAWIRSLSLSASLVAGVSTVVPAESTWTAPVFIQVSDLTSKPNAMVPLRNPVMQIDGWSQSLRGTRGKAFTALEYVRDATYTGAIAGQLTLSAAFQSVKLWDVSIESEPHIVPDPRNLVHVTMDLSFVYVVETS